MASIFADIVSGTWPLDEESRETLAYYIALQMTRGPEQRRNMENLARQMTRMEIGYGGRSGVKRWAKKNLGFDVDESTAARLWGEAMRPEGPPIREYLRVAGVSREVVSRLHERLLPPEIPGVATGS